MREKRRIRFASIEGLERRDLRPAGEVWLDDVCRATWTTRETMKLAAHLVRYMQTPDPALVSLSSIEHAIQLDPKETKLALRLLELYGAVEAHSFIDNQLHVALHLSELQRLRVLEAQDRLATLMNRRATERSGEAADRWLPPLGHEPVGSDEDFADGSATAATAA